MSDEPKKKRFQVLMVVRVAAEIEATDQADAERRAEHLAVRDGAALPLRLIINGEPEKLYPAIVDDVEVADVDELEAAPTS